MRKVRHVKIGVLGLLAAAVLGPAPYCAAVEDRDGFVEKLRAAGYHDMVVAYLERVQKRAGVTDQQRAELTFRIGQTLLDWAAGESDLAKRSELLERAEETLRAYLEQQPNGAFAANASFELARLLFERGRLEAARAQKAGDPQQQQQHWQRAREWLGQARQAFLEAAKRFRERLRLFPAYIDPRRSITVQGQRLSGRRAIQARRQTEIDWIVAQFHAALAGYETAQSFPEGSAERAEQLRSVLKEFERLYQRHRILLVGLHARLWMARCFEELGDVRRAVGLYDELLRHDPAEQQNATARTGLQQLQRKVRVHWIAAQNRLGHYRLAYDAAAEWLRRNRALRDRALKARALWEYAVAARELAKELPENDRQRRRLLREAIDAWATLAREESDYRELAVLELQRWGAAQEAQPTRGRLTFTAAVSLAEEALESERWQEAARYFAMALRLADQAPNAYQLNNARLRYGYVLYQLGELLAAAVLTEHVALRYSDSGLARAAANISMASYWRAYRLALTKQRQRAEASSLRDRAVQLAKLVVERWPESEEADFARSVLGSTAWAAGDWEQAARYYEAVGIRSSSFLDAQLRASEAWWQAYVERRRNGDSAAAEALRGAERTAERVRKSLQPHLEDPPEQRPVDLARAELLLARVRLQQGRLSDAKTLIEPYFVVLFARDDLEPIRKPLLTTLLRLHLQEGDVAAARRVLELLRQTGATDLRDLLAALAQQLAERVQVDHDRDLASALGQLARELAQSARPEDADTLRWLVPTLEGVGEYEVAEAVCRKLLELYANNPSKQRACRLLLASVLRHRGDYAAAARQLVSSDRRGVLDRNPRAIDAIMEYGRVLSWWALEDPSRWDAAIRHWNRYGRLMGMSRRRPNEYYQAWAYLLLSHLGKLRHAPQDRRTAATTRALVQYALRTMPSQALDALPQGSAWADVVAFADRVGVALDVSKPYRAFLDTVLRAASVGSTRSGAR